MARLQRTERLATLGQVAGGVAHELRNPLNVVKTSVYYLLNARNPTPEKTGRPPAADRAERRAGRQRHHVAVELRQGAGARRCGRSPSSRWCARRSRSTRRATASRSTVDCPAGLPHALGDGDQLRIALGNLIRNARDAMPQGGRLAISGQRDRRVRRGVRGRYGHRDRGRRTWPGSWSRSTRPRPAGWAWGLQSPGRSWKRTRGASAWPASRDAAAPSRSD